MSPDYRAAIADVPRPSAHQVEDFVAHVFQAHSWYKHLPLFAPGLPFAFFLDPSAGLALRITSDGVASLVERREGERFFHYNEMPTRRFRERFGHLKFVAEAGTKVLVADPSGALRVGDTTLANGPRYTVTSPTLGEVEVPDDVVQAGTVELTGLIHRLADSPMLWTPWRDSMLEKGWPVESGGQETLARLHEVVDRWCEDDDTEISEIVRSEPWPEYARRPYDLHDLIEPERERQRREAVAAIGRMLDLALGPAKG